MFETILVPLDGSELAEAALPAAAELQAKFGSHIILMRSVEPLAQRMAQISTTIDAPGVAVTDAELLEEVVESEEEDAKKYLNATREKLGGKNIEAFIVEAEPADAIANLAAEHKADLIVMSSHGRGGLGRLVFGSVADAVLHHSKVPVLLIRSDRE
jgi:nucleotide-binding universal stress UspA family protein